jgi:macrolide transport system ATP-binding/permease protein
LASLVFSSVSFSYDSSIDGLFSGLQFGLSEGWTGILGENGSGKTTLLRLACRELQPRRGGIEAPPSALYCLQRTDRPMEESAELLIAEDGEAYKIRGVLGIGADWLDRWETLSHGERKRLQIATCLWLRPELLAVDEPTNHLDAQARERVRQALAIYRGIGLLVSHDRDLLDALCLHSLFVSPPTVTLRSGGYTVATAAREEEARSARAERERATQARKKLERELHQRRRRTQKAEKAKSLRGVDSHDHDARAKARAARIGDSGSGKSLRQLEGRHRQAEEKERSISVERPRRLGIGIRGQASDRNAVLRVRAGRLDLGPTRKLEFPDLLMQPIDRVALTGPNGGGKSTLVRRLLSEVTLPEKQVLYMPQEIPAEESAQLLETVLRLPPDELGLAMQWVSRLGSDPDRMRSSRLPSPGEVRKLLLAVRMLDEPRLIVMDEPTNHMDLPSVECLESALRETCCALLLVSHDRRFLDALTQIDWAIASSESTGLLRLSVQRRPERLHPTGSPL